jgi:hypothetical protein
MGIDATLGMLKNFVPEIIQDLSLNQISTDVEILWETNPYTGRDGP